jgi:hypothetical protein
MIKGISLEQSHLTKDAFIKLVDRFGLDESKYKDFFTKIDKKETNMTFEFDTGNKGKVKFILYYKFTDVVIEADPRVQEEFAKL